VTSELLHLSVANSGIEIVEVEQKRIFDKFYRIPHGAPWKHGGTGLGLAIPFG
jgi:signal transduction histidine kinase